MNLLEILFYKKIQREKYRNLRDKYGYGWQCLELANEHWLGRYPLKIASYYSSKCVALDKSHKSSIQMWKEDKKREEAWNKLYPDSVDLF